MALINASAHRVLQPLNWSHSAGRPVDGDVKSTMVAGQKVYFLRSQPRGQRPISGVSLFVPAASFSATHIFMGSNTVGCVVTVPGTPLPAGLGLVHDGQLMLRLYGADHPSVECGQHYTVYATADMAATDFEVLFQELMSTCVPCTMQGQADPALAVDNDDDGMPGDPLVSACVMALDNLVATTDSPNTRLLARLFAQHLQAADPDFTEVLRIGPLADMAAAALSGFTVRDPILLTHMCDARDRLAYELGYSLPAPPYEPHWVSP